MKSFRVIDGKVKIDGVLYGPSPSTDVNVMGKSGRIHSINIGNRGQFFPLSGEFNDGTITMVDSTTEVLDEPTTKKKSKATKSKKSSK